jgi:hypothetical protein
VFSDVHFHFHGAATETTYAGSIQIGFFEGSTPSYEVHPNITIKKNESIMNSSVTGSVSTKAGSFRMTFALVATSKDTGQSQQIRDQVEVVVK